MATLNREINFYVNGGLPGGRNALLAGKTDAAAETDRPSLMQGDVFAVNVYFRQLASDNPLGSVTTALEIPSGAAIIMAGKLESALDGDALFMASSWAPAGSGDDVHYTATLNLNTPTLVAAFAASQNAKSLPVYADVEVQNADNSERLTFRLYVTIYAQAYQGNEVAIDPQPSYRLVSAGGIVWRLTITDDGELQQTRI